MRFLHESSEQATNQEQQNHQNRNAEQTIRRRLAWSCSSFHIGCSSRHDAFRQSAASRNMQHLRTYDTFSVPRRRHGIKDQAFRKLAQSDRGGAQMWSRRNERLTRLPCKVYLRRRGSRLQRRYSTLLNLPALGGHMPVGTGFGIRFLRATPRSNTIVSPPVFRFCRPQW